MTDVQTPKRSPGKGEAAGTGSGDGDGAQQTQLIVGIGATTSARDSLTALAAALTPGASYIVCLSYQTAMEDAGILKLLSETAALPVEMASEGEIAPDRILLLSGDQLATLDGGKLKLRSSPEEMTGRGRIDSLFVSLAKDQHDRAVGIVLQGAEPEGTLGIAAIKENDGLTIAEDGVEAERAAIGGHASAASLADYLLPADRIGNCIAEYAEHLARRDAGIGAEEQRDEIASHLNRIVAVLRNRTGHDFHGYKRNTFLRRVQRRMQVTRRESLEDYVAFLRDQADETQRLFDDLLIGVTAFFRDRSEFDLLEREVIAKLFAGKTAGDQVRVWVLGCATGEEAYSIAMLLREHMATLDFVPQVQIFATDIDNRSLAAARAGRYTDTVVKDVGKERLARWFIKEGNTYLVAKELREMCIFSQHSLIKDAPFSRIDLVSCRNLLIYLDGELQNRVIPLFHFALRPGGYLFLGTSENVTRHNRLFVPIDRRFRIFQRQDSATRVLPDFPLTTAIDRSAAALVSKTRTPSIDGTLARRAERIAERYAPAYVVTDEHHDVLHFSGRTGRFLDPVSGAASLNLLNLVHRDLRLDLRSALQQVVEEGRTITIGKLKMATPEETLLVTLTVEPVPGPSDAPRAFMVIFEDGDVLAEGADHAPLGNPIDRDEHVLRLEAELRLSRERLQSTIEELESTNEELKSSNEEYQSINEELQSANEELETSKEELQSVNEELQTVNGELGHRVTDLAHANSDLKNLLESTQIATVFLDNDMRVKMFTPAVAEIFHLIEDDIDRPISHIASRIHYPEMQDDIRRVMRTLGSTEREVDGTGETTRYLVRVLPYRSVDNFIAGVVITFLDVSATARAEQALRQSEERFRNIASSVQLVLFISEKPLDWSYVNARFSKVTGMAEDAALGEGWLTAVHSDDIERLQQRWHESHESGEPFDAEFRFRGSNGRYRWFLCRGVPRCDQDGTILHWYGACTDVHERHIAEDRLKLLMAELQHRVKNILAVVRSIFARTVDASESIEEISAHFSGRLDALARTQSVLVRTPGGDVDLEEMLIGELLGHGGPSDDRITIAGAAVRFRPAAAEAVGLLLHELTTNAAKYGALANSGGKLAVTWRVYDNGPGPRLALEWRETGVAIVDPEPQRNGFGRELIERGIPYQIGATSTLEFLPGGIRCSIELPLTERVALISDTKSGADMRSAVAEVLE